jgi:hypothetical protein
MLLLGLSFLLHGGCGDSTDNTATCSWSEYAGNPVISFGQETADIYWNDPHVIKNNDGSYRMWLSGGDPVASNPIIYVNLHHATSSDGITWDIDPTPVLEHDSGGGWDNERVETPSVAKVDDTWHMYYSGRAESDSAGVYSIGHATSTNGLTWIKDPNNPVITFHGDPTKWGYYTAAEPAAVAEPDGSITLYYVTLKAHPDGSDKPVWGIARATSADGSDGSTFSGHTGDTARPVVLDQTASYQYSHPDFYGFSTPFALLQDGVYHLFVDTVADSDPATDQVDFIQTAIAHATSSDGVDFAEAGVDIVTRTQGTWTEHEVRGPSALLDNGVWRMWFAGNGDVTPLYGGSPEDFQGTIGLATRVCP